MISQQKKSIACLAAWLKHLLLAKLWSSCRLSEDELSTEEGEDLYAYLGTEAVTRVEDYSLDVARE